VFEFVGVYPWAAASAPTGFGRRSASRSAFGFEFPFHILGARVRMLITVRGMGEPQDAYPILSLWLWPVIDEEAIFCSQHPLAYLGNDSLVCSARTTCMVPTCQGAD
jgi:hypothetical protein